MAFFEDMSSAIRSYPDDNVVIEIVDLDPGSDGSLNTGEQVEFSVRITNNGVLDMTGVTLRLVTDRGATLRRPPDVPLQGGRAARVVTATWVEELVSQQIAAVPAQGGTATSETFTLKAPTYVIGLPSWLNLLTVSLDGWDAGLGFLLNTRSVARAAVNDTFAIHVRQTS